MNRFLNKREINKRIVAYPISNNPLTYGIKHDIPGEKFDCEEIPSLEIAGCIVKALRERQALKLAAALLANHMRRKR